MEPFKTTITENTSIVEDSKIAPLNPPVIPRIMVAGCGYWGKNLVRNFDHLQVLVGVIDPSVDGRKTAGTLAPGIPVYETFEKALLADKFSGIAIATPAVTHFEIAAAALNAGLDVLVEKPIALR